MCTPARALHGVLGGPRGAFVFRRRHGQAHRPGVLPGAGELPQSSSKMAALLAVNSGKRGRAVRDPREPTGGGAGLPGALVQSGRSEWGREFVRRACFRRFPACSPAPPRFEWRAARLQLCPGDECLKGRRSGGVPGGQARGPEAAPSQRYPSGVGRLTFTKVRLKSRAERSSRGWKEAGLEAGRGPVLGQGVRSCPSHEDLTEGARRDRATGSAHAS